MVVLLNPATLKPSVSDFFLQEDSLLVECKYDTRQKRTLIKVGVPRAKQKGQTGAL